MTPSSYADLVKKRQAHRLMAESTFGMMGRGFISVGFGHSQD